MKSLLPALLVVLQWNKALVLAADDYITINEFTCDKAVAISRRLVLQVTAPAEDVDALLEAQDRTAQLEKTVVDSYNELSFESCDFPHFRTLESVAATVVPRPENKYDQFYPEGSTIVLEVVGSCSNCTDDLPLLISASAEANVTNISGQTVSRQENGNDATTTSCICPASTRNSSLSLSVEALVPKINVKLDTSELPNLTVTNLMEVQEVDCGTPVRQFTSYVYMNVNITLGVLPPPVQEIQALEEAFVRTYNSLSFTRCDPYFRTVLHAKLDLQWKRYEEEYQDQLQTGNSSTSKSISVNATTGMATALFTINGECRNCSISDTGFSVLFDRDSLEGKKRNTRRALQDKTVGSTRTLHSGRQYEDILRYLKSNATGRCTCPLHEGSEDENDVDVTLDFPRFPSPVPSMSQQAFLSSYNTELNELQEEDRISALESVINIEEGQKVECGAQKTLFRSEVFSDLQVDLQTITKQEVRRLEEAFLESYNQLRFRTCDGLFRTVEKVELRIAPVPENPNYGSRRLQDVLENTSLNNSTFNTSQYVNITEEPRRELVPTLFAVTGQCRDCPVSQSGTFNLFDDAFRRRKLQSTDNFISDWVSISLDALQGVDPVCTCIAGEAPSVGQGPSTSSFGVALTVEIEQLDQQGKVDSVEGEVGSILEGAQVNCNGELQDFTSYIYTDLGVSASQIDDRTKERMENVFADTYNHLSFQACDEFFRVVSKVGLVITNALDLDTRRRYLETNNESFPFDYNETRAPFAGNAYFEVTGRCRNCPLTSGGFSLFDDAFRRHRFLRTGGTFSPREWDKFAHSQSGRRLQEALDVCLCPQGKEPGDEPPPSTSEFLVEFTENIIKAQVGEELEQAEEETKEPQKETTQAAGGEETSIEASDSRETAAPLPLFVLPVFQMQEIPVPPNKLQEKISWPPTAYPVTAKPTSVRSATLSPFTANPTTTRPISAANFTIDITATPTVMPTTSAPTQSPTPEPTPDPTPNPTLEPTPKPSLKPSPSPTPLPVAAPNPTTVTPTAAPIDPTTVSPTATSQAPAFAVTNFLLVDTDTQLDLMVVKNGDVLTVPAETNLSIRAIVFPSPVEFVDWYASYAFPADDPGVKFVRTDVVAPYSLMGVDATSSAYLPDPFLSAAIGSGEAITIRAVPSILPHQGISLEVTFQLEEATPVPSAPVGPSSSPSDVQSDLPSDVPSEVPSLSVEPSSIPSSSNMPSDLPSQKPSVSMEPSSSAPPSNGPSYSPSSGPSISSGPSESPTVTTSPTGSANPTVTASNSPSDGPSLGPSVGPSNAPSPQSSNTPSSTPSQTPSAMPSQTPSLGPSSSPSISPTMLPTTLSPTVTPGSPSRTPTKAPTVMPTQFPSRGPTGVPSQGPSNFPTNLPSQTPSGVGSSVVPSQSLSFSPSIPPSTFPSSPPSVRASDQPSISPSVCPSKAPSVPPSSVPSSPPSHQASDQPSISPSVCPSKAPSVSPSSVPSISLSGVPSLTPSFSPTAQTCFPDRTQLDLAVADDWTDTGAFPYTTYGPIENWCFDSGLTDFSNLFFNTNFDEDISSWDTSSALNMLFMFQLSSFNQAISGWDVAKVTIFDGMFQATPFNQDIGSWDTSSALAMFGMFESSSFNQAISGWDVAKVTIFDSMFLATPFNQDIGSWDTSSAVEMSAMFGMSSFNQDISGWDVSKANNFEGMFSSSAFNQDLCSWSTGMLASPSAVANMFTGSGCPVTGDPDLTVPGGVPSICYGCVTCFPDRTQLDMAVAADWTDPGSFPHTTYGPIENWCFDAGLIDFGSLFSADGGAMGSPTENINGWDMSNAVYLNSMFLSSDFNQDISGWDVGNVVDFTDTFYNSPFNSPIGNWDTSKAADLSYMFAVTPFNQDISGWDVSKCTSLLGTFFSATFNRDINGWDVGNVVDFENTFYDGPFNSPIGSWDTSSALTMFGMFDQSSFNQDISGWDVSKVTNFHAMVRATPFNMDIGSWDTSKAADLSHMFAITPFNQDISGWDVSKANDFSDMFSDSFFNQDLCSWGTAILASPSNVTDMFFNSDCPFTDDPDVLTSPVDVLCYFCLDQ